MSHKKCAVLGCEVNNGRMFAFPGRAGDETRLQKWIMAAGNPHLLTLPKRNIITKTICEKHFDKKYILQRNLSNTAIPTLYLPEPITEPCIHEQESHTNQSYASKIQEDSGSNLKDKN